MAQKLKLKGIKLDQPTKKGQEIFLCGIKIKHLVDETYFKIQWWKGKNGHQGSGVSEGAI